MTNRMFKVHIGDQHSRWRKISNGLPQASVLVPILFILYIHDMSETVTRKFQYADDTALVFQHQTITMCEVVLEKDLSTLNDYFYKWRLKQTPSKTEAMTFHLNNKQAAAELKIKFD